MTRHQLTCGYTVVRTDKRMYYVYYFQGFTWVLIPPEGECTSYRTETEVLEYLKDK